MLDQTEGMKWDLSLFCETIYLRDTQSLSGERLQTQHMKQYCSLVHTVGAQYIRVVQEDPPLQGVLHCNHLRNLPGELPA